jgi:hypothetical protein
MLLRDFLGLFPFGELQFFTILRQLSDLNAGIKKKLS